MTDVVEAQPNVAARRRVGDGACRAFARGPRSVRCRDARRSCVGMDESRGCSCAPGLRRGAMSHPQLTMGLSCCAEAAEATARSATHI
eukprot:3948299-Prymnesium_polylepis.1